MVKHSWKLLFIVKLRGILKSPLSFKQIHLIPINRFFWGGATKIGREIFPTFRNEKDRGSQLSEPRFGLMAVLDVLRKICWPPVTDLVDLAGGIPGTSWIFHRHFQGSIPGNCSQLLPQCGSSKRCAPNFVARRGGHLAGVVAWCQRSGGRPRSWRNWFPWKWSSPRFLKVGPFKLQL